MIRKRYEQLEKRIRELEAAESVRRKQASKPSADQGFATKDFVEQELKEVKGLMDAAVAKCNKEIQSARNDCDQETAIIQGNLDHQKTRIVGRINKLKEEFKRQLNSESNKLHEEFKTEFDSESIRNAAGLDTEAALRKSEIKSLSRMVQENLESLERRMAEKHEEQDSKWRESSHDAATSQQYLHTTLEERLAQLQIISYKDMGMELDRREELQRAQWEAALNERPTRQELTETFTRLETSSRIVDQLKDLQENSVKHFHRLQAGLSTVERLYLRELDAAATMVSYYFASLYMYDTYNF